MDMQYPRGSHKENQNMHAAWSKINFFLTGKIYNILRLPNIPSGSEDLESLAPDKHTT
jgi:hypothetical protein